jgi:lipopolysaccharide/colanic/teichoic acid biosynthesis glycosyltransferase
LRYKARVALPTHEQRFTDRLIRALNVIVALFGIVVTSPIMLVTALLIKLTSPGPVIYKQKRVGLDRRTVRGPEARNHRRRADYGGQIFTIYKFRTMREDGKVTKQVWASADDPRITPVGRVLRATRVDEIPQFFNVLRGDMNIVGPRPEQPQIFEELSGQIQSYRRRQRVLPGITGLAQVELGYDTTVERVGKKVELDLQYIRSRSAAKDLMIMAKTIPVMVSRKVWM